MASTSPARASRTASVTASPAILPACSGSRERGAGPAAASEGTAPRSPLPRNTRSASSGPRASAFSITSGPIPRGSPSVTASRGRRLETDVDVRGATQQIEMVLDGELLAQPVADAILHLVEPQLAFGKALQQLEHHEPRPPVPRAVPADRAQLAHVPVGPAVRPRLRHGDRGRAARHLGGRGGQGPFHLVDPGLSG